MKKKELLKAIEQRSNICFGGIYELQFYDFMDGNTYMKLNIINDNQTQTWNGKSFYFCSNPLNLKDVSLNGIVGHIMSEIERYHALLLDEVSKELKQLL